MIGFISGFVFEGLPGLFIKVYKFQFEKLNLVQFEKKIKVQSYK